MSKVAPKKGSKSGSFEGAKFINYSLSEEQKRELKEKPYTEGDFAFDLHQVCDSFYKVSFSYDTYNNCMSCFFTPKDEKSPNKGLILTARGSTALKAFKQAMYLHYTLFEENWADFYEASGREEIDD